MDPEELESRLRTMLAEAGLVWVLQQVDDAISAGRAEVVTVKSRRGSTRRNTGHTGPIFDISDEETQVRPYVEREPYQVEKYTGPDISKAQISTSPLSASDRVRVLLEAIQRLLVELPRVHRQQVKLLHAPEINAPSVEGIEFRRDEGAPAAAGDLTVLSDQLIAGFAGEELDESVLRVLELLGEEVGHG
ncbi:hypothetical protein [Microbispora sp. H11081]|uniref:hypothetical protein n=1 Tax=Microbispora sp. H11081 TaxID=2729107 RepID=UPI00147347E0|nr:hypothetical protein [Microbispora sp. H11081]